MALAEVPSKVIERTESLMEAKLRVASELTQLLYSQKQQDITEEKLLRTYMWFYAHIKDLLPAPLDKPKRALNCTLLGFLVLVAAVAACALYFFT